ncbi:hypothetical protein PRIPAC_91772 [Pristionchus pacificus]|uniref:Uncharacterized protein n=1 Tax=Pristionchus pacificus TaxID=54126 RepID=A0A2A6BPB9_PRIPA|nr:hypothetical protein PRIPAC_91772 [Pristionchus pacificus]|eukprot:PDM67765.1 hypothetical protein PRIPAC_45809 [Pristionchus pacificus]
MWRETKRDEREEENREESALESGDEESEVEEHENVEEGVKIASRLKAVDTKEAEDKKSGVRIARLDCSATFDFLQISHETAGIFILLYRIFSFDTIATLKEKAIALEITEPEWREFLLWSASKLTVRGVHIIPRISYVRLWKLIASSTAASKFLNLISIYESVEKAIFSPLPEPLQPGFPEDGVKTNVVTKRDYDICNAILKKTGSFPKLN